MPTFNYDHISYERLPAAEVEDDVLEQLYDIEGPALQSATTRAGLTPALSSEEIHHYRGDLQTYAESRRDPQLLVERGQLRGNQEFHRPHLIIAFERKKPIGYAQTADNVSGDTAEALRAKRLLITHNFHCLRNMVVAPDQQGRGIPRGFIYYWSRGAMPLQPGSFYVRPQLTPKIETMARNFGLVPTNAAESDKRVYPFGEKGQSRAVEQLRYEIPRLRRISGIATARASFDRSPDHDSLRKSLKRGTVLGKLGNLLEYMLQEDESERRYVADK